MSDLNPSEHTMKKFYAASNGCPENRIDTARVQKYLVAQGWEAAPNWQNADLILFNTCGQTDITAWHSIGIIKEIENKKKAEQQLIIWGCLPKIDMELLKENDCTGFISPGADLPELPALINAKTAVDKVSANTISPKWPVKKENAKEHKRFSGSHVSQLTKKLVLSWEDYLGSRINLVRAKDPTIFYIKISTGCQNNCAYCAIRKSRGKTRSKPIENIVSEFKEGLQKGFKRFSFLGTDLGSYGVDIDTDLVNLLTELTSIEGKYTISLRNVHPYDMNRMLNRFIPLFKTGKIPYIELAAESGNNRILELMNRKYTIEEYKNIVKTIRQTNPDIIIRTQLIAGFPTETEEEFLDSMRLLDEIIFDYVEVYEFSPRKGTPAEKMEQVPDKVKRDRFIRLYKKALLNRTTLKIKDLISNKM
jgi:tRNA A37 methylthiotransferase MiaB